MLSRFTKSEELMEARKRYAREKGVDLERVGIREKRGGLCFYVVRAKKQKQ
jgi:hypothetical protein